MATKTFLSNGAVIFTAGSEAKARDITLKASGHTIVRLVEKHA